MKIPTSPGSAELVVKRSRFLSKAQYFDDAAAIKSTTEQIRLEHQGCNHVVYAFAVGDAGTAHGLSDDHEPKGTAGRPVLEVVKGSGITNVLVTVVRYFGGTKLGTGGLVKAYTEAAQLAIAKVKTEELIEKQSFEIELPYSMYEPAKRIIADCGGLISAETFEERVAIQGTIPVAYVRDLEKSLADASSGGIVPRFYDGSISS